MNRPRVGLDEIRRRIRVRLEAKGTYRRWVLISAFAGMFATSFPITILAVSLTDVADDLDTSISTITWAVSVPILLSAVCLPLLGKLGDLRGHRRVFLVGFTLATVVSALTALSWHPLALIGFRSLAQVIGASTQPTALALVMLAFPKGERVRILGYWSLVGAGAPAIGLIVGGPLIDLVGWRFIFVAQAGLAAIALVIAALVLPESERRPVRVDVPGAAALAVVVGAALLAVGQGDAWGLGHPAVVVAVGVIPAAIVLFVAVERRSDHPLVPLDFFFRPNFTVALVTSAFIGTVWIGGLVLAPLALRDAFGWSATATAAALLLRTGVYSLSSPLGGRLGSRWGTRPVALSGAVLMLASMVAFTLGGGAGLVLVFCLGLVGQGLGNGIVRPPVAAAMMNSVPESDLGMAAALQRMMFQIGNGFGLALLTALYDESGTAEAFVAPFALGTVLAIVTLGLCARLRPDAPGRSEPAITPLLSSPTA
jgi:MFS family permease